MGIKWERWKKEPSVTLYLWEAQIASVTKWRQMRGMGIKWEREKKEPSARVLNRRLHRFCGKLKLPRWQSEDRWEEWVSRERGKKEPSARVWTVGYTIFVGSSNRLGDGVKTDERNGYQMREGEERTVGYRVLWEKEYLILEFQPVLTCPTDNADLDTGRGNLGRKKTSGSECMKLI